MAIYKTTRPKLKIVNKDKENHFKMGKVPIHQEHITSINIYETNNKIHETITKKKLKEETIRQYKLENSVLRFQ